MLYLLVFFYIFGFKIYSFVDSTILCGIFLTLNLLCNKNYSCLFLKSIRCKTTFRVILVFLLLIIISLFSCTFGDFFDFTYTITLVHFGVTIFIGYELFYYFDYHKKADKILNYLIVAFIIQTAFQWICYIFPSFSSLFNYFRSSSMIEKSIHYKGFRGIALSQSGFFSLSATYALIFLLFFSKYNTIFIKSSVLKFSSFVFLLTGTFFAGRTGYVGLLLIPLLIIINKNSISFFKFKIKTIRNCFICALSILLLFNFINYMSNSNKLYGVYYYTFELFQNYENGLGFRSTSTDRLLEMYDIDISFKTFMIGDGRYSNGDNGYYGKTDVGYLRKILYFGIFGLVVSFIFQILLMGKYVNFREKILLLFLLIILELKGEIIGLNIMLNSCLILYSLYNNKLFYNLNNNNV